ncbi:L-threonylcarbamoyladenylate synthase, partial [Psychrobacter urativorans]|uniref:L-threonylcarbamoyladenylate synthase n=1 Tax=Psychrobacter urativorans TaxID=45610 RepID=UPI003BB54ADA
MKTDDFSAEPVAVEQIVTSSPNKAAQWLNSGKLLAYPTESVWGIGCNPFNQSAVEQLLAIKQRPIDKGMIVVTDHIDRIAPLLNALTSAQRQSIIDSWQMMANQQAQTWLLPLSTELSVPIPSWITGAHNSVAVRVIAHPLIKQLCSQMVSADNPYGFIVSTSCNPSGQPPALSLEEAHRYFFSTDKQSTDELRVDIEAIDKQRSASKQMRYLSGPTLGYQ